MGNEPGDIGAGPPSWAAGQPPNTYPMTAAGPVRYFPVSKDGQVIGYLWYAEPENAAGYLRRLAAQDDDAGLRTAVAWYGRLETSHAEALPAAEAVRRWAGAGPDPDAGTLGGADAEESAPSLAALGELANPGYQEEPVAGAERLTWPDGTPVDRSKGWEDLSPFTLEKAGYAFQTDSAVSYVPVIRGGEVLGYLWASPTEDAADYQRRLPAGAAGFRAGRLWLERLDRAKKEGLPPLEALRRWVGAPEDPQGGGIAADAEERTAPSLESLKEIARR